MKRLHRNILSLGGVLILMLATSILGQLGSHAAVVQGLRQPADVDSRGNAPQIRLQYDTFDPAIQEPAVPASLRSEHSVGGRSTYIVQFHGPIQAAWKHALTAAGAHIDSYLPDYAFVVQMDEPSRARAADLDSVRWIGDFHPAYKMAPVLSASPLNLYRLMVAGWATPGTVQDQLKTLGFDATGSGRSLIVEADFQQLHQIARLSDVLWIEPFQFFEKQNDIAGLIMDVPAAWNLSYTGFDQIVTVADTGLDTGVDAPINDDMHRDLDNRVDQISSWRVIALGCIANPGADDGAADVDSGHGTHVAGSVAGNGARSGGLYSGPAFEATLTFQAIEQLTQWTGDCALQNGPQSYALTGIPADLNELFQEAYGWGSRVHTNSWGVNDAGKYPTTSQQADQFTWEHKDFTVLFAAGNFGTDANPADGYPDEDSMASPATAKNVITIGASENLRFSGGYNPGGDCSTYADCWATDFAAAPTGTDLLSDDPGNLAGFSGRGPTDDGRIKPDLVAPGTNILSTRSSLITSNAWGAGPNSYYMYSGGTSMATPLAAGAATVVRDYLTFGKGMVNPSAALVKAILINTAVDIGGYGNSAQEAGQPIPNNHEGWGRIALGSAISDTNRTLVEGPFLPTGVTHSYFFTVTNSTSPLKTTLVWTDFPGIPMSTKQLVNDLDLIVTAPDGITVYWGNDFTGGWSTTGGTADDVNNVENVYVQSPSLGVWTIQVSGFNVPQDPQPYALVIDGMGAFSGPIPIFEQYLPVIVKAGSMAATAGYWASTNADEFYITPDSANVDNFAINITVLGPGCGGFKITHNPMEPIANEQFSFVGNFYASGNFKSATRASGTVGLNNFNIPGCGLVSGGPWLWTADWQSNAQPLIRQAEVVVPDSILPVPSDGNNREVVITRRE